MISVAVRVRAVVRRQRDEHAAAVQRRIAAVYPDERRQAGHVRLRENRASRRLLPLDHRLERHRLRRLGDRLDGAGVLDGEEALRHRDVEDHRQDQGRERHEQRQRLVPEHPAAAAGHTRAIIQSSTAPLFR